MPPPHTHTHLNSVFACQVFWMSVPPPHSLKNDATYLKHSIYFILLNFLYFYMELFFLRSLKKWLPSSPLSKLYNVVMNVAHVSEPLVFLAITDNVHLVQFRELCLYLSYIKENVVLLPSFCLILHFLKQQRKSYWQKWIYLDVKFLFKCYVFC